MHVSRSLGCKTDGRRRLAASSPCATIHTTHAHKSCFGLVLTQDACWMTGRQEATCSLPPQERRRICISPPLSLPPLDFLVDTSRTSFLRWLSGNTVLLWDEGVLGNWPGGTVTFVYVSVLGTCRRCSDGGLCLVKNAEEYPGVLGGKISL